MHLRIPLSTLAGAAAGCVLDSILDTWWSVTCLGAIAGFAWWVWARRVSYASGDRRFVLFDAATVFVVGITGIGMPSYGLLQWRPFNATSGVASAVAMIVLLIATVAISALFRRASRAGQLLARGERSELDGMEDAWGLFH